MIRVDKMEAFALVVKAMENDDEKTAREIMNVISKSIKQERSNNRFSQYIEIEDKKVEKFFKGLSIECCHQEPE